MTDALRECSLAPGHAGECKAVAPKIIDEVTIRRVGGKWCATALQNVGGPASNGLGGSKRARVMEISGDIWGDSIGEVTFEILRAIRGERPFGDPA